MTKIVNGVIVKNNDGADGVNPAANSENSTSSITLFGYPVPRWTVYIFLAILFFVYGLNGFIFGLMLLVFGFVVGNTSFWNASQTSTHPVSNYIFNTIVIKSSWLSHIFIINHLSAARTASK
jgi:hypothetical protein